MSEPIFPWSTFRAVVGGTSAIDVPRLNLRTPEDAAAFLECYGYRVDDPGQAQDLESVRTAAWEFIEQELLPPGLIPPQSLRGEVDVASILLLASAPPVDALQRWACALLRVMHTFAHVRSPFAERYAEEIRQQIVARFEPHVFGSGTDLRLGDGPDAVPLVRFEVREVKPLTSVALKLLHKVENVAADIFDRVGVRFVTPDRMDALLVVRYLRVHNVTMFANIKPSRTRNGLVDMVWLERMLDDLGGASEAEQLARLRPALSVQPYPPATASGNLHSALDYRSIQFTCRQQIRVPDGLGGHLRFFFPYEVQIMDKESWARTRAGLASHVEYKRRQRETVRQRVLGTLLGPDGT